MPIPMHPSLGFLSHSNDSSDRYNRSEFHVRFLLFSNEMVDGGDKKQNTPTTTVFDFFICAYEIVMIG
jgi:hypothetical protein